jgi:hypothetical protein
MDDLAYRVAVLPVTLVVSVLCKYTLITGVHVLCISTLVMMVVLYTVFLNIYFNIILPLTTSSLKWSLLFKFSS